MVGMLPDDCPASGQEGCFCKKKGTPKEYLITINKQKTLALMLSIQKDISLTRFCTIGLKIEIFFKKFPGESAFLCKLLRRL